VLSPTSFASDQRQQQQAERLNLHVDQRPTMTERNGRAATG